MNKGRFNRNGELSDVAHEHLRYVSDEDWEAVQRIIGEHIYRRELMEGEERPNDIYGAKLLSGLIFCAECGARLSGVYQTDKRGGVKRIRPVYRDYKTTRQSYGCRGQTTYSAEKVEAAVLLIMRRYFRIFNDHVRQVWDEQFRLQMKKKQSTALRDAKTKLARLSDQHAKLKDEIMKALMGESDFDKGTLQGMLNDKQLEIDAAEAQVRECEADDSQIDARVQKLTEQFQNISDWAEVFDRADDDGKRMILSRMIERIAISRGYHISIQFYIAVDDFRDAIRECQEEGYQVKMADNDRVVTIEVA